MSNTPTKHPVVYLPNNDWELEGWTAVKDVFIFTEEQLLDLRKKWAADAWDNGVKRESSFHPLFEGPKPNDKQEYISNLKIN